MYILPWEGRGLTTRSVLDDRVLGVLSLPSIDGYRVFDSIWSKLFEYEVIICF